MTTTNSTNLSKKQSSDANTASFSRFDLMNKTHVDGDERFWKKVELYAQQPKVHDLASMPVQFTHSITSLFYGGPQEPSHKTFLKERIFL